ncbi:MAG: winged helix-turn-helix transcriptional regulator [Thermoplasmatales archaeon]|nr:winged helix-turn-helix transcriptional regulator [Thermoplasmatales archaeon]
MRRNNDGKNGNDTSLREGTNIRKLYFYLLSLFLAVILILISITILVTVIYLNGHIGATALYLLLAVVLSNISIAGISLRGIAINYSNILFLNKRTNIVVVQNSDSHVFTEKIPGNEKLTTEFFTETELEIIDLLMKNNNRMLQNTIVQNIGLSKASASRAISSLENKGIIIKTRRGVTNEIILPETYFK